MDDIIYNISLVILTGGVILMIVYITMIITKKSINSTSCTPCPLNHSNLNQIYDDRPSITYKKMFNNFEVGFGYQDFDINDNSDTTSFYIKSKI
jgi:hypothetical protein